MAKMLERARAAEDRPFDETLRGPGANQKKQQLLKSWLSKGFSKDYASLSATLSLTKKKDTTAEWTSLAEAKRHYGPRELALRLQKGTLEWRRDPDDDRFFQVRKKRT